MCVCALARGLCDSVSAESDGVYDEMYRSEKYISGHLRTTVI
jgi:hypothetical protein